jgi:precorrin-2/cobalt-factor-2 C20-methyltransferase
VKWGVLYGIGVGPGDPELLTLKGLRVLAQVPVIFYPTSTERADGFALEILRQVFEVEPGRSALAERPLAERLRPLVTTMPRGAEVDRPHWDEAAVSVGQVLQRGQDAAFITEGDPLLYSTFMHLRMALAERFPQAPVEVIPGISSVTAAAARALFPLAGMDERVGVIPATYDPDALARMLDTCDTVVLLKVSRVLDRVLDILEARGLLPQTVFVERCGTVDERVVSDVKSLRGQRVSYFSLLLVRNHQRS